MIVVDSISKSFGQRTLWSSVSFTAKEGEMVAIVGPSGCGKSTLLNCLGLLDRVDQGAIEVAGRNITRLRSGAERRFRRNTLGYLFQNYALIENANVEFNLSIAAKGGRRRSALHDRFAEALRSVGLEGREKEMVYRLSGGEQQRLALARLVVKKPTVVLADEPTGALDSENSDLVIRLLRKMAEEGCAVAIATHSKSVQSNCDFTIALGQEPTPR